MPSHSTLETLKPILQTYSVLAITLAAGTNLSTTIVTLPALLPSAPSTLATQWKTLFDHGITPVVSLTLSSVVGFTGLAYHAASRTALAPGLLPAPQILQARNLYAAAAVAALGLVPYTQILMGGINAELSRRAGSNEKEKEKESEGKGESTHVLVRKWGRYNLIRGCMLLVSGGLGMWACVVE